MDTKFKIEEMENMFITEYKNGEKTDITFRMNRGRIQDMEKIQLILLNWTLHFELNEWILNHK